jgi:hypothetical protein
MGHSATGADEPRLCREARARPRARHDLAISRCEPWINSVADHDRAVLPADAPTGTFSFALFSVHGNPLEKVNFLVIVFSEVGKIWIIGK